MQEMEVKPSVGIFKQLVTDDDNTTHDIFRWLALASVAAGISLQIFHTVDKGLFDMQQFGIGVGALLAGVGAAIKLEKTG